MINLYHFFDSSHLFSRVIIAKRLALAGLVIMLLAPNLYGQVFTPYDTTSLTGIQLGPVAWGDFDNDGDLDILAVGSPRAGPVISKIYRNDNGRFVKHADLRGISIGSAIWGDYDNDGDLDILLTGRDSTATNIAKIYRNDSGGAGFVDIQAPLEGVRFSRNAWGDYDNDGDLDILLTGESDAGRIAKIYRNDKGAFVDINAMLPGVYRGSVAWGDFDNDSDLDIFMTGFTAADSVISKIYRNEGSRFLEHPASLVGVFRRGSVALGDYDEDGDLDLLLAGETSAGPRITKVYQNDRGRFVDIQAGLEGINSGPVAWGDYDNDGDLDILLAGKKSNEQFDAAIFKNENNGSSFRRIESPIAPIDDGDAAWGDYDNDGDLDILQIGKAIGNSLIAKIFVVHPICWTQN